MSASFERASPQITAPRTLWAICRTASKSPGEAIGKPASMTSTPKSTRAWAISIFSVRFMLAPGDCSPSRSVVSKITIFRFEFVTSDMAGAHLLPERAAIKKPRGGRPRGSVDLRRLRTNP